MLNTTTIHAFRPETKEGASTSSRKILFYSELSCHTIGLLPSSCRAGLCWCCIVVVILLQHVLSLRHSPIFNVERAVLLLLLLLLLFPHISPISRTRGHRRRLPFPYHRYIQKTQTKEEKERKKITDEKTSPDLIGGEGKK